MKAKFLILVFLLLFVRGCDFYSTSLWFFDEGGMEGEMNPLTVFFGVGWYGLIGVNFLIVSMTIVLYYHYCFRRRPVKKLEPEPVNYREYASLLYFNRPDWFYRIFFRMPDNRWIMARHAGYVLIRVMIAGSILATLHNLFQYYDAGFYDWFRDIVKRPLFVIYGLIAFSLLYFMRQLLMNEFREYLIERKSAVSVANPVENR